MVSRIWTYSSLVLVCVSLLPRPAISQDEKKQYEVRSIIFEGNRALSENELQSVLQTRETPSWFWKALYTISEKIGERAEYFEPATFDVDYMILRNFYVDKGFFHSRIDTSLAFDEKKRVVDLYFKIVEGPRSYIDTLTYLGLAELPGEVQEEITSKTLIRVGDAFEKQTVAEELRRILSTFLNYGYVNVRTNTPEARRYTSTNNIALLFSFVPGNRYRFGDIRIDHDTTALNRVSDAVILRHIDFSTGDFYSETKKFDSERNLNRLGVFERVQIEHLMQQSVDTSTVLPMRIFVRPRTFQELSPELGINDERNTFNVQFGLGYVNRNFFGEARNLSTLLRVNVRSIQEIEFKRVVASTGLRDTTILSTAELSTQLVQPYFFSNKLNLVWTISAVVEKDKYYYIPILRNRVGVNFQQAQFTRMFFDWDLERVSFSKLVAQIDSSILERLTLDRKPQFNSIFTFTVQRDRRNDLFSPSSGFFHSGTLEEAGLLPSFTGSLFGSDLPYSKYIKVSGVGQWYWDPSKQRKLIWAFRTRGGFAQLYGHSPAPVPFTRRFFAGGGGSVRGWRARDLGAIPTPSEGGTALFEANLEARWYLFRNFGTLWFLELPKLSLVLFVDAGSVWKDVRSVRLRETALASGFGIRFDTIAGPFRIDFGFRAYDPFEVPSRRWITQKRFFPETFSNGVLHFGVGHAF